MSKILSPFVYYFVLIPISVLPFPVLYIFSDFLYVIIYYIVGYRKDVVRENLKNSFPKLSDEARKNIEKKFYKHFSDFLVESAKTLTISEKAIRNRCKIMNPEMPISYYEKHKSIVVLCGHYNNWEYYALGLTSQMKHITAAAYKPLKNPFFNAKFQKSRQRYGIQMIPMKKLHRYFDDKIDQLSMTVLLNDQSPVHPSAAHWNSFLNQDTGWMKGPEKLARKYNYPVLFGCIRKKKRGFYEVTFYPITDNPKEMSEGEITNKHTEYMTQIINEAPEYWLWSHKRWKHEKPESAVLTAAQATG